MGDKSRATLKRRQMAREFVLGLKKKFPLDLPKLARRFSA
jgi:hypothetical protein